MIKFALLAAAFLISWEFWVYASGRYLDTSTYRSGEVIGYTVMVLAMSLIFFAIKQTRDRHWQGSLSFGRGMAIGTGTNLIASIVFGLFNVFYVRVLAPDFLPAYYDYEKQKLMALGTPQAQEQLATMEQQMDLLLSPEFMAFVMFATVFLIGVLVTIISTLVLKKT